MFFFTHLYIAKVLYKQLSKQVDLDFKSFSYGNIKPDLPSTDRKHHTLDIYLPLVCEQAELLRKEEMTVKEFSVMLGEICHYVSDFFCLYHLNDEIHDKNLRHFSYEIFLHFHLLLRHLFHNPSIPQGELPINATTAAVIMSMRESYFKSPKKMQRDMNFALSASYTVCATILECVNIPTSVVYKIDFSGYGAYMKEGQLL